MNEQDNTAYFEAFEDFWGAPSDLVEDDDALAIGAGSSN